ncbi:hypothetical protein SLE2022_054060 [Rubroshorea leprosula]
MLSVCPNFRVDLQRMGDFIGMPIYMDPTEQGVSHHKHPPHIIPNSSVQSSQRVVQLQQIVAELQENQLTLHEKVDKMERMFFMMQGGMQGGGRGVGTSGEA